MVEAVEHLPSKCKTLSSNPVLQTNKKKRREFVHLKASQIITLKTVHYE
jgi:hypothetical protein